MFLTKVQRIEIILKAGLGKMSQGFDRHPITCVTPDILMRAWGVGETIL